MELSAGSLCHNKVRVIQQVSSGLVRVPKSNSAARTDSLSQKLRQPFTLCRVSRLAFAAAAAGRSTLGQPASGSHVPAAGISVVWEQMAACLQPGQQKASIHTSRQMCRAEPAEELQEDHRAALRSVTPKVSRACRRTTVKAPLQMQLFVTKRMVDNVNRQRPANVSHRAISASQGTQECAPS